jgi:FimV-like protein
MNVSSAVSSTPVSGADSPTIRGGDASKSTAADAFEIYESGDTLARAVRAASAQITDVVASRSSSATDRSKPDHRTITVSLGDALWTIAGNYDVVAATRYQKMVAILAANPHAFIDNDINRLKAGATLSLPAAETVLAVNAEHAQRFSAYQINAYEQTRRGTMSAASRPG